MFLYEMHLHTKEVSACAGKTAAEMVRYYKEEGYTGIFITDHFFNGNTTVDRSLPWDQMVANFMVGYDNAVEAARELDLDVFFGWEYSFHGNDFLTYGLDRNWLLAHPEIMEMSVPDYCDFVKSEGGMVVHAHPIREAGYIDMIRLIPRNVEGVEVYNANRSDFENRLAYEYAENYGLLKITGSDNHWADQDHLAALGVENRIKSDKEMLDAIRTGKANLIRVK